ncbi:hypothetical protein D0499_07845 [Weissella soli]|uniref:hypothetical protein n=1 Tax=Weissella soli TaxID=155866 RepID=UPI0021C1CFC8|nr:hypothetical protein [Weissella soli]MCT8395689.1 hypothetical protein [Weissella soli]
MVRQGQYAKTSQLKRVRQFRQNKPVTADQQIDPTQLEEFLIVRYHLTQNERLTPLVKETMQRFLMVWLGQAPDTGQWDLPSMTAQALAKTAAQVPWQFYALLLGEWEHFQKFLQREIPAVQLAERKVLVGTLSRQEFAELMANQMALNWFLQTFKDNHQMLERIAETQVSEMQKSFLGSDGHGNWANVGSVYATTILSLDHDVDAATRDWLRELASLQANQLQ